ncbi:MAG: hypothetical protein P4L51_09325 [Puia sp.]|nr:hypothetical protein [Puia sp.]
MNTLYKLKKMAVNHSYLLLAGIFIAGMAVAIIILKIFQAY